MSQSSQQALRSILPYTEIVGQEKLKLALELAYIAPKIGGVLVSGRRGTAKSTTVRAFASMMYDALPITIPINATEDRVIGGWEVKELMTGNAVKLPGLLEEANDKLLYIDEVNLLDDHIVNIILDVTSTGTLVIQREGLNEQHDIRTTLVGTMNPEEGGLRPQLLDRFGLMVAVEEENNPELRLKILTTVLEFDRALQQLRNGSPSAFLERTKGEVQRRRIEIRQAQKRFYGVQLSPEVAKLAVRLATEFEVEGHRSDYLLALSACAYAARQNAKKTTIEHLSKIAELVLRHRTFSTGRQGDALWDTDEIEKLQKILGYA